VDDAHHGPYAREPQVEDLARICRALNEAGARYLLIGGFAVIAHGGARTTKDIDLLVDAAPENVALVKQALQILEIGRRRSRGHRCRALCRCESGR